MAAVNVIDPNAQSARRALKLWVPMNANGNAQSGTGGAAHSVTYDADAARGLIMSQFFVGFDGAPAAGTNVSIESPSGTVIWGPFGVDPTQRTNMYEFNPALRSLPNTAIVLKCSAPGGAVKATLMGNVYAEL